MIVKRFLMIKDPMILFSFINTQLRDKYINLDDLCEDLNLQKEEVIMILNKSGYFYDDDQNKFIYQKRNNV